MTSEEEIRPTRLTEDQIKELARDMVAGQVYVPKNGYELECSFAILFALGAEQMRSWVENIGMVYEYMKKAAPRQINGLPMFFSMRFVHKDDMDALFDKIEQYEAALSK